MENGGGGELEPRSRREGVREEGMPDISGGGRRVGVVLEPDVVSFIGVDDREIEVICAIGLNVIDEPGGEMLLTLFIDGGGGRRSGMGDGGAGQRPFLAAAFSTRSAAAWRSAAEGLRMCVWMFAGTCFLGGGGGTA